MPRSLGLRAALLAGVTLVAAVTAFAIANRTSGNPEHKKLPPPAGGWYRGLAAPYPEAKPGRGACGLVIGPTTMGVGNPVLPCGVKIYLSYGGKEVLTQVIDRGRTLPGREFDVTRALAKRLGLSGTRTVAWRFAR